MSSDESNIPGRYLNRQCKLSELFRGTNFRICRKRQSSLCYRFSSTICLKYKMLLIWIIRILDSVLLICITISITFFIVLYACLKIVIVWTLNVIFGGCKLLIHFSWTAHLITHFHAQILFFSSIAIKAFIHSLQRENLIPKVMLPERYCKPCYLYHVGKISQILNQGDNICIFDLVLWSSSWVLILSTQLVILSTQLVI